MTNIFPEEKLSWHLLCSTTVTLYETPHSMISIVTSLLYHSTVVLFVMFRLAFSQITSVSIMSVLFDDQFTLNPPVSIKVALSI